MTSDLYMAVDRLRTLVNDSLRIKARLMIDRSRWLAFCSALDVVADTDMALDAYLESTSQERGVLYLATYGALQALVVQQEAARALLEGCNVGWPRDERLQELRVARILSIGHPTKADRQPGRPSCFILQASLRRHSFDLLVVNEAGGSETQAINVQSMIADQRTILSSLVETTQLRLMEHDREHRAQYRSVKLAAILDEARWHLSKARELLHSQDVDTARERGNAELGMVETAFHRVRDNLVERGELEAHEDTLTHELQLADHCIQRIRECLNAGIALEGNRLDAHAFGEALGRVYEGLHSFLQDLDREYAE